MLVAEMLRAKGQAVYSIRPDLRLSDACQELARRKVGALIVCEDEAVVGVLSERDVVRAAADGGEAALAHPISHYMSAEVVFAAPAETAADLMQRMTERRIRHLPVMQDGRLIGVISIGDVVKHQIDAAQREAESLKTYIAAG